MPRKSEGNSFLVVTRVKPEVGKNLEAAAKKIGRSVAFVSREAISKAFPIRKR